MSPVALSQMFPDVPETILRRMQPDIMLVEDNAQDRSPLSFQVLEHVQHTRRWIVHDIELGFGAEILYSKNLKEESEQHGFLLEHLRTAGYVDVQLHLLIFGSLGGIFRLTALHLVRLGVAHPGFEAVREFLLDTHWKTLKRLEHEGKLDKR